MTQTQTHILGKVGQRFLLKQLENDTIGELELIAPGELRSNETRPHAKWWDGELTFKDHLVPVDRIVEYTPENIKLAGKQTFKAFNEKRA